MEALMPGRVLMTLRDLPESCVPGFVTSTAGGPVVTLDPSATLRQAVQVCVDGLTTAELNLLRAAFGEPPVPAPISDAWMRDDACVSLDLIPDEVLTVRALAAKQARRRQSA